MLSYRHETDFCRYEESFAYSCCLHLLHYTNFASGQVLGPRAKLASGRHIRVCINCQANHRFIKYRNRARGQPRVCGRSTHNNTRCCWTQCIEANVALWLPQAIVPLPWSPPYPVVFPIPYINYLYGHGGNYPPWWPPYYPHVGWPQYDYTNTPNIAMTGALMNEWEWYVDDFKRGWLKAIPWIFFVSFAWVCNVQLKLANDTFVDILPIPFIIILRFVQLITLRCRFRLLLYISQYMFSLTTFEPNYAMGTTFPNVVGQGYLRLLSLPVFPLASFCLFVCPFVLCICLT